LSLTSEQEQVAAFGEGGLVLVAAAGTGKTHTITQRVVRLINKGVTPSKILCITFTNKAAQEMKERISATTGIGLESLSIFTFHGFCNYWLRKEGHRMGKKNYTIMDQETTNNAIKSICSSTALDQASYNAIENPDIKAKFLTNENADQLKDKFKSAKTYISKVSALGVMAGEAILTRINLPYARQVFRKYEEYKATMNLMDFEDLHKYGTALFNHYLRINEVYEYLQVDEAQDCGEKDLHLLKAINISNILAVGD